MEPAPRCAMVHIHDLPKSHGPKSVEVGNSFQLKECKLSTCISVRSYGLNIRVPHLHNRGKASAFFYHSPVAACGAVSISVEPCPSLWSRELNLEVGDGGTGCVPFCNTNKNNRANLNSNLPFLIGSLKY